MNRTDVVQRQMAPLRTPSDLGTKATTDISAAFTTLLADMFALYIKTKDFTGTCPDHIFATTTCCSTNKASKFSRRRTRLPSEHEKSEARRSAQLGTLVGSNVFWIMTRTMSRQPTCSRSSTATTSSSSDTCVRHTLRVTNTTTSLRRAYARTGSTKASEGYGSYTSPRDSRLDEFCRSGRGHSAV
jgi:hypothetical protein